ncbi:MAG: trp operon repressor [Spirochaetaceae bacterium]|jgi:TrpR family trp operon transcriptional repressor|nr:trp operon repressor [Spirochaetaceae bacterium]
MGVIHDSIEHNIDELSRIFALENDGGHIKSFLRALWTPAELADLAARWALVKALREKTPQREIAKKLGISLCKITRGSRELKKPDGAFLKMLELAGKR